MAELTERQRLMLRKGALWSERATWLSHWREISEYQQPRMGRYMVSDTNKGWKRHNAIYDETAIFASRTLAAGMMSGMTSPARPWFRMSLADRDLMEFHAVKDWLFQVAQLIRDVFTHSNTYRALHMMYEELGLFGTAATIMLPDFNSVIHHFPLTVGEYALATDDKGSVNTLAREFQMTVGQLVQRFGLKNCSLTVRNLHDRGSLDAWVPVLHMIQPRADRDPRKRDARSMAFSSQYLEIGNNADNVFLSDSGFERFPALCPRWAVTGNDVYGSSPGMEALGSVKQLQHEQLRKGQAIDYLVNPPLQVPTQFKDAAKSRLPGGVMYVDAAGPAGAVRSAFDVRLDLSHLLEDIGDVRHRIDRAYYADLFLMISNDVRSGVTATEIAERHEEKLLMLGPVLERLQNEMLQPLVESAFHHCAKAGILPDPPPELQGKEMNIEFTSVLAQAQRAVSAQGMDRLLGTISSLAGVAPTVVDTIDFDRVVDEYADAYGTNPKILVPPEVRAATREQRAKAQASQAAAASMPAMADAAKSAGDVNTQGLKEVMNMFQGYGAPTAA